MIRPMQWPCGDIIMNGDSSPKLIPKLITQNSSLHYCAPSVGIRLFAKLDSPELVVQFC